MVIELNPWKVDFRSRQNGSSLVWSEETIVIVKPKSEKLEAAI